MAPKKFWRLEFYEWTLWIGRITHLQRIRQQEAELLIELERGSMSLLANVYRGKDSPIFKPTDFYKLSYDKVELEESQQGTTGQELMPVLMERFKNKPVKKKSGSK